MTPRKKNSSKALHQDPYAEREAQKYAKPIVSREYILDYLKARGKPANFTVIATDLALQTEDELEALRRRLNAMCRDGQLTLNRREGFGPIDKMNLIAGRVLGHRDGFGFVVPDDNSGDLVLNPRQMRRVFDGDRVLVRVSGQDYKNRREATIVDVLEHNTQTVVGRYYVEENVAYVTPENKRIAQNIFITADKKNKKAKSGQVVEVTIITQPSQAYQPTGFISEVLGDHLAAGAEIDIALRAHQIPHRWPKEVTAAIKKFGVDIPVAAKKNRLDLTGLPMVTIDGEDAQDFDDAVFAEKQGKNYRLIVTIADVSHYVAIDSPLDHEAMQRGTSVYFPGKVIPMLPEILSNELCSLKPHVDRLCMGCALTISPTGKILNSEFFNAVMHSHARLTYNQVQAMLDGDKKERKRQQHVWPMLQRLNEVYHILLEARKKRGALDFETIETQIIFGADKKIEKIVPRARVEAHKLIEECMLAANVAAAQFLSKQKDLPILYRVHNGPKADRLQNLRQFLAELGLSLPGKDKPTPKDYATLLAQIPERPDAHIIQTMLLRSLSQAVYAQENAGHFGLAYDVYTHFTSPIRRYPDLMIHRALKHAIAEEAKQKSTYPFSAQQIIQLGEHCSLTERRADDATRDALLSLKCQFLKDKVGQEFFGIISHVTSFGLFVELQNIYVEGLIHISSLQNDYYLFDATHQRLCGERTGKVFHLGDKLKILIARVDVDQKRIDFELIAMSKKTNRKVNKKKVVEQKPQKKKKLKK